MISESLRERLTAQSSESNTQQTASENAEEKAQTESWTDSVKAKKTIGRTLDGTGEYRHCDLPTSPLNQLTFDI